MRASRIEKVIVKDKKPLLTNTMSQYVVKYSDENRD